MAKLKIEENVWWYEQKWYPDDLSINNNSVELKISSYFFQPNLRLFAFSEKYTSNKFLYLPFTYKNVCIKIVNGL